MGGQPTDEGAAAQSQHHTEAAVRPLRSILGELA
jgi:hypothetical protein